MRHLRFFLCALALALAACGGGGLEDKALSELTGEDLVALCEDSADIRLSDEEFTQIVCNIAGIMAAEQGGDCQGTIDACLADPPVQDPPEDCSTAANEEAPNCPDVTVGELLDCYQAQIDQLRAGTSLTCEDDYGPILNELPAECTALIEICPELGGSESQRLIPAFDAADLAAIQGQQIAR